MKILYESPDFLTFCKCTELEVSLIWVGEWILPKLRYQYLI